MFLVQEFSRDFFCVKLSKRSLKAVILNLCNFLLKEFVQHSPKLTEAMNAVTIKQQMS